jgi:hypothetical protein
MQKFSSIPLPLFELANKCFLFVAHLPANRHYSSYVLNSDLMVIKMLYLCGGNFTPTTEISDYVPTFGYVSCSLPKMHKFLPDTDDHFKDTWQPQLALISIVGRFGNHRRPAN